MNERVFDGMIGDWLPHKATCRCEDCQLERAQKELKDARAAIHLLTAALDKRVWWTEEGCSGCATGKRCELHAALEAGRKWSER